MKEQNNFAKENQETMEIQEKLNKISKTKSRQLGRLIEQLKKINILTSNNTNKKKSTLGSLLNTISL